MDGDGLADTEQPSGYPSSLMEHQVSLRPLTHENLRTVIRLSDSLTASQGRCVAKNIVSIAQAYVSDTAWVRVIYLGDEVIGFVMLDLDECDVPDADRPAVGLWRFMIGRPWQGKGYGRQVLDQLVARFADRGIRAMYTSVVLGEPDGPYDFYIKYGFIDTGEKSDDEEILRLSLASEATDAADPLPVAALIPRVALITVWVEDMGAMRSFYRDLLGLVVKDDHGSYVEFEHGGVRFALCERSVMQAFGPAFNLPAQGQRFELAFRCGNPEHVDEAYTSLVERGAVGVAEPQDMPWKQRMALFSDPEGNIHEVFADLDP